tara:strand:+ start:1111 stop:1593 length:483 start_codon:yes stop_codon:yes gene_type:complete
MATTATNKQPLLVDRPFHSVVESNSLTSGSATSLDILGTNESSVLVDCTSNDGAIVEDLYVIARSTVSYKAVFYLSTAVDYLRPSDATYIQQIDSATTAGQITSCTSLPKVLAPLPGAGSDSQVRALYIPKGSVLWCSLQLAGPANSAGTPVIAAQGGFY